MPYRELSMIEVREVLRRYVGGAGLRAIARGTGLDRKTVAKYLTAGIACGLALGGPPPMDAQVTAVLAQLQKKWGTLPRCARCACLPPARPCYARVAALPRCILILRPARCATGGGGRPAHRSIVVPPDRTAAVPRRRSRVGERGVQDQAIPATGRAGSQRAEHGNVPH